MRHNVMAVMKKAILSGLILLTLVGCGTITNMAAGPMVMGGFRSDLHFLQRDHEPDSKAMEVRWFHNMELRIFASTDITFSFLLDIVVLPITFLAELSRWITGWPPWAECQTHGGL